MVQVTRRVFGQQASTADKHTLQSLMHTPADSLLRKLCASCHLGQQKTRHRLDVTRDRGGGCLACHLNDYPGDAHPALSARVEDGRCFGCHSRSSRISLSYAGLAEVTETFGNRSRDRLARLADGRLVEHRPADIHHRAGMSCIDCHTGAGLMGYTSKGARQDQSVDIACSDCHANRNPRVRLADWPAKYRWMLKRIPFLATEDQEFLTTENGTPLWNIEVRANRLTLHLKLRDITRPIPVYHPPNHEWQSKYQRLTCNACHAQWAPQCYECHLRFSPDDQQWDHVERKLTPGHWSQHLGKVRNELPLLGVTAQGNITTFVPGMIMTVDHPDWEKPRFRRLFGSLSPHTTGRSRTCEECHLSPIALGLGEGQLEKRAGHWTFVATHTTLDDGLPADAWTRLGAETPGEGTHPGDRSFSREEILRVLTHWKAETP